MSHALFALMLLSGQTATTTDCGAVTHRAQIAESMLSVKKAALVEPTIGELPTKEGTRECVRVEFSLTPWGTIYRLRFAETSHNYPFEVAVRRAIDKYEFQGSLLGLFDTKTLVFEGVDNKRPESWGPACAKYDCGDRPGNKPR
ncbi:MAG TPA: hypothetical protein VM621_14790 [Luteibacter sp.]|uniref:hypothetical protein n=1 Tax=Luteibacter sp. TaxID=1886636 RepID=UPI002B7938CF|nr:hypothetical protein [Luteibacter sp.]HVI56308.1 hypothetical protein [Luteibacter sp.]